LLIQEILKDQFCNDQNALYTKERFCWEI